MTALRSITDLDQAGLVPVSQRDTLDAVAARYAVSITPYLADLIDRDDPADPIARQFVPSGQELDGHAEELEDPIGDAPYSPVKGIVHRYADRVLLKIVQACPVYCRFCFRREMVGPGSDALDAGELDAAIAYIEGNPEIWEVILTGGDPMILSPRRMGEIITRLNAIPHLGLVRIHTRVPLVDPARVDAAMLAALKGPRIATWVVLHSNHWREFGEDGRKAIARLVDAGIPMLGQSVLMRGVNDDVETLTRTFRTMISNRIKPYHLNHGDLAKGTSHFRTSVAESRALIKALRGDVSGLCQPTYILDIPGGHGKVPLTESYLTPVGEGEWIVEDPRGGKRPYQG